MSAAVPNSSRTLGSRLGLGRLAYLAWHAPKAAVERSIREGGPLNQWHNTQGRRAMERAAPSLPTSRELPAPTLPELHFLTGKKFWYQTAFCLHSLQVHSGLTFRAVFHDDGSFDAPTIDRLRDLFPSAKIRCRAENDARVAALLPPDRFPTLHAERRQRYPNFLKLTDVHAGEQGWRLVLDSDMLFFRRPGFLLSWLAAPDRPLHLLDIAEAYGYPLPAMSALAAAPIQSRVNVGFCGLNSNSFDWIELEYWAHTLIERYGTHYYLEQALSAMMFARQPCAVAPRTDYLVLPTEAQCVTPTEVLHHYVAESKRGYFRHAWRHVFAS